MTVSEMIEFLQQQPPQKEVVVLGRDDSGKSQIYNVSQLAVGQDAVIVLPTRLPITTK